MNKNIEMKIIFNGKKAITRKELFNNKENFHKKQARLPFDEKVKIVYSLQKIADTIKSARTKL